MHPATATLAFNAHIRDLERAIQPTRNKRPRRRRSWIGKRR